ncbi:hypothetical protein CS369_01880 [Candidatus Symbiopectobacterium sp. 'North America']|uniref:hypothetical protein n=1 Tax=Candidatus Symbiopectobacterium sp. 'North America' TaxID=2794574 RepID=UPI0018CA66D5|nr:hypothetical protein [Candidatus Symbiopectobacterium sp. 'North America']MBG6243905.1 hypothetical protein [Candidatus Symbiopectobacterium sp. 'North America']
MCRSEKIISDYLALSSKEQIAYLRSFNQNLDAELCDFFLCIALDKTQEASLRKEAMNVISLFKGHSNDNATKKAFYHLIRTPNADIQIHAIGALGLMYIDENDLRYITHLAQHSTAQHSTAQ